jgi:p-cumic aldehyde dehydrogenase
MLIGADRTMAQDGRNIPVEDPATGQIFAHVPAGGAAEVDKAVRAARKAFESAAWSRMRPLDRARIIETIARKIEENAQELALLESYDNGKAVHHALAVDVPAAVDIFRYMAGWASKIHGQVHPFSGDGRQYHSYSLREPIGVVGQIVPWNYPLAMAAWKVATALAAGCTIVLKPSEVTPLTALRLAELALEAGLPEGVLNVVTGYGHEAGQALVEHPGVDKIAFTGSTRVGKQIVRAAAADLKRVTLELGGKSPSLIFADADLDKAAIGAALAIFFNSGQVCLAASRLYVERSVFDRVVEGVAAAAKALSWAMAAIPIRCSARWFRAFSSSACWTISNRAAPAGPRW